MQVTDECLKVINEIKFNPELRLLKI